MLTGGCQFTSNTQTDLFCYLACADGLQDIVCPCQCLWNCTLIYNATGEMCKRLNQIGSVSRPSGHLVRKAIRHTNCQPSLEPLVNVNVIKKIMIRLLFPQSKRKVTYIPHFLTLLKYYHHTYNIMHSLKASSGFRSYQS